MNEALQGPARPAQWRGSLGRRAFRQPRQRLGSDAIVPGPRLLIKHQMFSCTHGGSERREATGEDWAEEECEVETVGGPNKPRGRTFLGRTVTLGRHKQAEMRSSSCCL